MLFGIVCASVLCIVLCRVHCCQLVHGWPQEAAGNGAAMLVRGCQLLQCYSPCLSLLKHAAVMLVRLDSPHHDPIQRIPFALKTLHVAPI